MERSEMDEMVSYIFRSMRSSELTLRGVKRVLKNQARRNRNFKRFAWLTVGYLVISEINRSLMEKKIKELRGGNKETETRGRGISMQ